MDEVYNFLIGAVATIVVILICSVLFWWVGTFFWPEPIPQVSYCDKWIKTPVIFIDKVNGKEVRNPTDIYTCEKPNIPKENK